MSTFQNSSRIKIRSSKGMEQGTYQLLLKNYDIATKKMTNKMIYCIAESVRRKKIVHYMNVCLHGIHIIDVDSKF